MIVDKEFQSALDKRRQARMARIDRMPADVRALVHEYGLSIVIAFMDLGIVKPKHIRHCVETVLNEMSPTRSSCSSQGPGSILARKMTEQHVLSGGYRE